MAADLNVSKWKYCGECCTPLGAMWLYCAICGTYLHGNRINEGEAEVRMQQIEADRDNDVGPVYNSDYNPPPRD